MGEALEDLIQFSKGKSKVNKFAPIDFPHRHLTDKCARNYRVYKDAKEYISIEALTAKEAIEKSGIESPYRVIREKSEIGEVISPEYIIKDDNNARTTNEPVPNPF